MLKRKNRMTRLAVVSLLLVTAIMGSLALGQQYAGAQEPPADQSHFCQEENGRFIEQTDPCIDPGGVVGPTPDPAVTAGGCQQVSCNRIITEYVDPFIKVLSVVIGVVIATSIVVAGIQYSSAGSDPGKVAAAKKRLTSALLSFGAYLFTFAFLQWLLPGGVL